MLTFHEMVLSGESETCLLFAFLFLYNERHSPFFLFPLKCSPILDLQNHFMESSMINDCIQFLNQYQTHIDHISVIWWSVLLVDANGVPSTTIHGQTLISQ